MFLNYVLLADYDVDNKSRRRKIIMETQISFPPRQLMTLIYLNPIVVVAMGTDVDGFLGNVGFQWQQ